MICKVADQDHIQEAGTHIMGSSHRRNQGKKCRYDSQKKLEAVRQRDSIQLQPQILEPMQQIIVPKTTV